MRTEPTFEELLKHPVFTSNPRTLPQRSLPIYVGWQGPPSPEQIAAQEIEEHLEKAREESRRAFAKAQDQNEAAGVILMLAGIAALIIGAFYYPLIVIALVLIVIALSR